MALLPHQASVNDCPLMTMVPGAQPATRISNSFRRRLKGKERKLQTLAGYRYCVAATDAEISRLLDAFFRIKPLRMAEQKLPNVFAEPGVEDFIRSACMAPVADGGHVIDMHALECDDEVIAIFAGVDDGHRFSMMFNTYTMSENSRYSPGLILMRCIVDHYAGRGYHALDLGIGSDEYKRQFCKSDEPIFDCFIPLSPRGKLAAAAMSGINRAKHLVKHNQALFAHGAKAARRAALIDAWDYAPAAACATVVVEFTRVSQVTPESPGIPTQWFMAYFVLFGGPAFLPPSQWKIFVASVCKSDGFHLPEQPKDLPLMVSLPRRGFGKRPPTR